MVVRNVRRITRPTRTTPRDRARQVTVTVAEVLCLLFSVIAIGAFGPDVSEAGGGRFAADSTLITPAKPAFSIWSVIYTGLLAYTIWQWLPANATHRRARRTGWLAAASMALNALWLFVVQREWFWASVAVIAALFATLLWMMWELGTDKADSWTERLLLDATFGVYLGWVSVATLANIAATLAGSGWPVRNALAAFLALVVLIAIVPLARMFLQWIGPRLAVFAAMVWGVTWIGVGRFLAEPFNPLVGFVAFVVAAVVAAMAIRTWWRVALD